MIPPQEIDMTIPMLEFNYKFSALSAKYEIEKKGKVGFVAELIAIVGAFITATTLMHAFFSNFVK